MSGREQRTRGRTGFVTAGHRPFLHAPWGFPQDVGASRLRRPWLSETLARAFGLGHGAVVEQCPENPPDNRTKDVEPETRKIPSNDHRSQRARWVERPSRYGSSDEDPYRYGSDRSGCSVVCGHGHNNEHQYEGDQDLHDEGLQVPHPLCRIGGRKLRLAPCSYSAEGNPGGNRCEQRPDELCTYVMWGVVPGELACCGHP